MINRVKKRKMKSLYIWHRYAGIIAALFTLLLAITGIALNHTQRLQLDQIFVQADWMLDWYDIDLPAAETAYRLKTLSIRSTLEKPNINSVYCQQENNGLCCEPS